MKWLKISALIAFYLLSSAFWWNSGRKERELWGLQHKPTFEHVLIVRPQYDFGEEEPCTVTVRPHEVISIMQDGKVVYNTTNAKVKNCQFQWVVTENANP